MDQRAIVPITQLVDPVRAPYQNEGDCQRQEYHKHLEPRRQWRLLSLTPPRFRVADGELDAEGYEDAEREDLEGEAGDGDVDCRLAASG